MMLNPYAPAESFAVRANAPNKWQRLRISALVLWGLIPLVMAAAQTSAAYRNFSATGQPWRLLAVWPAYLILVSWGICVLAAVRRTRTLLVTRAVLSVPFFVLAAFATYIVFGMVLPGGRYASSETPADMTTAITNTVVRLLLCLPVLCYTAFCMVDGVLLLRRPRR